MELVPEEILRKEIIAKHLTKKDIDSLCLVSKQFQRVCRKENFWETLLKDQFDYEFWMPFIQIPMNTTSFQQLYQFFDRNRKIFGSKKFRILLEQLEDLDVLFRLKFFSTSYYHISGQPGGYGIRQDVQPMYYYKTPQLLWNVYNIDEDQEQKSKTKTIINNIRNMGIVKTHERIFGIY